MKFDLSNKFITRKIYRAWFSVAVIPAIWAGFPIYELIAKGKLPSLEFQLIMAVVFSPFIFMLVKPARKESDYWKEFGNKIYIELLDDKMLFAGPDGVTKLPYSVVNDIKLDIKWKKLKAIHIETKSGHSYLIEGFERLEEVVLFFRNKFPELAKNK